MNSRTLPSFWEIYQKLPEHIKQNARKAFHLWRANPYHPSLHFKCINAGENMWSLRITHKYRATGILEGNNITWFWIGNHQDYERFFS